MPKTKSLILTLSKIDYDKLLELSNDSNMKTNEFLRTLIQITYIANKGMDVNGQIEIGGYGITFPPEIMEDISNRLADSFKDFDLKSLEDKIVVKPSQRNYRTKQTA